MGGLDMPPSPPALGPPRPSPGAPRPSAPRAYAGVNSLRPLTVDGREPARSASAPYGWEYRTVQILGANASVSPLAAGDARIPVADFLP